MTVLAAATRSARLMAWLGLFCGVLYSFGGLVYDVATTGVNRGTALAFMALAGMPALFALAGFVVGALASLLVKGIASAREKAR